MILYSDPALRKIIKKRKAALIPIGSLEQHGPHLPVSTDSDIVSEIAKRLAKKCNLLLFPTIMYGVSFEHAPFFNLSITSKTLHSLLTELCRSLASNGIRKIIILNGHHGNQKALVGIRTTGAKVHALSYWHFMKTEFDHAGFAETSLMLALSDSVQMSLARKGFDPAKLSPAQRRSVSKLTQTHFIKATKSGVWGDPRLATRDEGRRMVTEIVQNLAKTVSKLT